MLTHAQPEGNQWMAQAGIHDNAGFAAAQQQPTMTTTAPEQAMTADPHTLALTAHQSLEAAAARLQTLHSGDINSDVRTRVKLEFVSDDRITFAVHHMHGRLNHTMMRGTLARRGTNTLVTAHIDNESRSLWLVALGIALLLGVLLVIQINLPMLVMIGALPLFVIRDSFTERRGTARLMRLVRQTFEG